LNNEGDQFQKRNQEFDDFKNPNFQSNDEEGYQGFKGDRSNQEHSQDEDRHLDQRHTPKDHEDEDEEESDDQFHAEEHDEGEEGLDEGRFSQKSKR
jgi:hypothetical protein